MLEGLTGVTKICFIGIKGVAMSGLAVICKQLGFQVAGSDVAQTFITDATLHRNDILVYQGFAQKNLDWQPDVVVIGTSWGKDNIEVSEAHVRGIRCMTDSEMRGLLSASQKTIAVTGVHGKTTTTALLSHIFNVAQREPSYLIGTGTVRDLGANAAWGNGGYFIVEGDEYCKSQEDKTPKFLDLHPALSIVTSLEWEHVDVFRDLAMMEDAFVQLIEKTSEQVIACGDWPSIVKITASFRDRVVLYGTQSHNDIRVDDIHIDAQGTSFVLVDLAGNKQHYRVSLCGAHNALNATAAIIAARRESIADEAIRTGLETFTGTQRRFDVTHHGKQVWIDDYGHHPTEVKVTLEAIRKRFMDKTIWCIFQPHSFTRTQALLKDFAHAFAAVHMVGIVDIFSSAREHGGRVTAADLAREIAHYHPDARYLGSLQDAIAYVRIHVPDDAVIVTMGAGDVYTIRDTLLGLDH